MGGVKKKGCIPAPYRRRTPDKTVLYRVVQEHFETYLFLCGEDNWDGSAMPAHVEREFRRYLDCGILARGFARARQGDEEAVRFHEAVLTDAGIQWREPRPNVQ